MSTNYIIDRHQSLTRQQVLEKFPKAFVSDDDSKGGITTTSASQVGVKVDGSYMWISFDGDVVTSFATYGHQDIDVEDWALSALGVEVFSEHCDDFHYHNFPADTTTAAPTYTSADGVWMGYVVDGWVYPYSPIHGFYDHLAAEVTADFDFDAWIAEDVLPDL